MLPSSWHEEWSVFWVFYTLLKWKIFHVDLGFSWKAWLLQRLHKEEAHRKKEATETKQNKILCCVCKQVHMTHSPFVNVSSSRVHFLLSLSLSLSHSHSRSWIPESNQEAQNIKLRKQAQSFTREGRTTVVALLISLQRSRWLVCVDLPVYAFMWISPTWIPSWYNLTIRSGRGLRVVLLIFVVIIMRQRWW
jgi:hypothetical protein